MTNVSLSPVIRDRAKDFAKKSGVSFSELIERSLLQEMERAYRPRPSFLEFFAGGGMARLGLGDGWKCRLANDFCPKKADAYRRNHGEDHLVEGCISRLTPGHIPGRVDLAWASFPCQDLSLAGMRGGLAAKRSGAFWPFWQLMKDLRSEGRGPAILAMENVTGLLTSGHGEDFARLVNQLASEGLRVAAFVLDAALFVPQSRKRVFVFAFDPRVQIPPELIDVAPHDFWHPKAMRAAVARFPNAAKESWFWLSPPVPTDRPLALKDIIENEPTGVRWHSEEQTAALLEMMTPLNRAKVDAAASSGKFMVGALYKRTRPGTGSGKVQRAEVRFDRAGCLRTPGGGSSRQTVVVVRDHEVRTRLISPREAARLMGLPDSYALPANYNDAYHLAGDGVVVPVVRFIAKTILEPALIGKEAAVQGAA